MCVDVLQVHHRTLGQVLSSLENSLHMAHLRDPQILKVSPLQVQELGAADVVADEGVFVLSQAELLQPDGHLLSTPPLN